MSDDAAASAGISNLSHMLLEVSDLQRSIDFYVGMLGLTIRERGHLADGREWVSTHQGVGLARRSEGAPVGQAFNHIAFRCPTGIDAVLRVLESGDHPFEEPKETPYGLSVYFLDPDGYRIECHDSTGVGGGPASE